MSARVGVVLSGCGVQDGSEIHEATSILIALADAEHLDGHAASVIVRLEK
jgi:enhancing lycopene biosynthesis protein 2